MQKKQKTFLSKMNADENEQQDQICHWFHLTYADTRINSLQLVLGLKQECLACSVGVQQIFVLGSVKNGKAFIMSLMDSEQCRNMQSANAYMDPLGIHLVIRVLDR